MKFFNKLLIISFAFAMVLNVISCSKANKGAGKTLVVEPVDPAAEPETGTGTGSGNSGTGTESGEKLSVKTAFAGKLGQVLTEEQAASIQPDVTGLTVVSDYDGDGIPNDQEIVTNKFVAEYPRIVTRISAPITMELRASLTTENVVHGKTVLEEDMKDTIKNSMEDRQYAQLNAKTTPYVTKESYANSVEHSESYGYDNSDSESKTRSRTVQAQAIMSNGEGSKVAYTNVDENSRRRSENSSMADSLSRSTMMEKTVFEDIDYIDNLDRHGVEFSEDTIENIGKEYRLEKDSLTKEKIGENAGEVRAALYIKNLSMNMPVKVTNVMCTLSFRTHSGQFIPVQTFRLRNEDWSLLEVDIAGDEEFGPYTIKVEKLPTDLVSKALEYGYVPQIHVVSYDMYKVQDSNYDVGVENLKVVEESAKGRTAMIKISGSDLREQFRVCAFDVINDNGVEKISPGISLKKALFNILRNRNGYGENYEVDKLGNGLTIKDPDLRWKKAVYQADYDYNVDNDFKGNSWQGFETLVKDYIDENNNKIYYETIKTIKLNDVYTKYNPFDIEDNASYNSNELLSDEEFDKMKYWVILHNGQYYEGDINDPIWPGERYEIIFMDSKDFNDHVNMTKYYNNPFQSLEPFYLETRWNKLSNGDEFDRSVYLGKLVQNDVITLEVDLMESRFLFDQGLYNNYNMTLRTQLVGYGNDDFNWYSNRFHYSLEDFTTLPNGIPGDFKHDAYGGINTITLEIEKSENAHYYEISFPSSSLEVINVTEDYLAEHDRKIIICRETLDSKDKKIGFIEGSRTYKVKVTAVGKSYGYTVKTESSVNYKNIPVAEVLNPGDGVVPGTFTFSAEGLKNSMYVRIQETVNAEYYLIYIKGPLNYNEDIEGRTIVAQSGINVIEDLYPPFDMRDGENNLTPGVFKVDVVAVNMNNVVPGINIDLDQQFSNVRANTESFDPVKYVNVYYQKYAKLRKYLAAEDTGYYKRNDLNDLEVNFNDGSGWHRILTSSNYTTADNKIKCWFSTYVDYKERKFNISFKAPTGVDDEYSTGLNVFRGGKQEVDVYIRTAPELRYRDTFWMKPNTIHKNEYTDVNEWNYITMDAEVDCTNFIDKWLGMGDSYDFFTDATELEDTINNNIDFHDGNNMDNYFFSPLEYRLYRIKASRSNTDIFAPQEEYIDLSSFKVEENKEDLDVVITDVNINPGKTYTVYYKQFEPENYGDYINLDQKYLGDYTESEDNVKIFTLWENEKKDISKWDKFVSSSTLNDINRGISFKDNGIILTPDKPVAIALETEYDSSTSYRPVFGDRIFVPKAGSTPPAAPTGVVVKAKRDGDKCSILVSNLVDDNNYMFNVEYKKVETDPNKSGTEWKIVEVKSIDSSSQLPLVGVAKAISIEDVDTGAYYDIRVCIVNSSSIKSAYTEFNNVSTYRGWVAEANSSFNYGEGFFFGESQQLFDKDGGKITTISPGMFDLNLTGDPDDGTCLRLVSNGKNIVSTLGLTPQHWSGTYPLPNFDNGSGSYYLYVDPVHGKFAMPRPIYWSICDSDSSVINPLLGDEYGPAMTRTSYDTYNGYVYKTYEDTIDSLGHGLYANCRGRDIEDFIKVEIVPFNSNKPVLGSGTASLWVNAYATWRGKDNDTYYTSDIKFYLNDSIYFMVRHKKTASTNSRTVTLFKNNVQQGETITIFDEKTFNHMLVAWEDNGRVVLFWNGSSYEFADLLDSSRNLKIELHSYVSDGGTWHASENYSAVDNIKVWNCNTKVSGELYDYKTLVDMEYNNGLGREKGLHPIYGGSNFVLDFTKAGSVGYYDYTR